MFFFKRGGGVCGFLDYTIYLVGLGFFFICRICELKVLLFIKLNVLCYRYNIYSYIIVIDVGYILK